MTHHRTTPRRATRALAALTAGALAVGTAAALTPAASAATASGTALYGSSSPTYDGVYRQSLAILGLHAADRSVPAAAVDWLLDQQCANGAFSSFNPNPAQDCPAYDAGTFSGGIDSNATALAAQALLAVDRTAAGQSAAAYLQGVQEDDGGWEYTPGSGWGTDPNSTALALTALDAAGLTPTTDPTDYFAELQNGQGLPSAAPEDDGGIASPYSNGAPDQLATVQAIPGIGGTNLLDVPSPDLWAPSPTIYPTTPAPTKANIAGWAATWLAAQVDADAVSATNLAWAVLSFATVAKAKDQAEDAYAALRRGTLDIGTNPGALGQAALAATALGETDDAESYADLIAQTLSTTPAASYTLSSTSVWSGRSVTLDRTSLVGTSPTLTQRVAWGDGTVSTGSAGTTRFTHTYTGANASHTISVTLTDGLAATRTVSIGRVKVTKDTVAPKANLTRPNDPEKIANWKTVKGTSKDTGLGVAKVTVRLVEKRTKGWYAYNGSKWSKKKGLTAANKSAKRIKVTPEPNGAWSLKVKGLKKGGLRVTWKATDVAGNTSAAKTSVAALTKK